MTPYEFFKLTSEVRRLQKEYFKTRDKGILAESKVKERILDAEIARVEAMPEEERNMIMRRRNPLNPWNVIQSNGGATNDNQM